METFIYIGKVSLYWVLLYACYWLMLRRNTFFQWNRAYLVGSLLVAFLLPEMIYPASAPELPVIYEATAATFTVSAQQPAPSDFNWVQAIALMYALGLCIALVRFVREISKLVNYLRSGEVIELEDCTIVLIDSNEVGSFSFLKWIVINHNDYEHHFDAILRHEMVHTHQRHSLDILLVEVLRAVFWFNPVLLLYKRSLQEIHEYLADAQATNREHYARFLVAYALNAPVASLTNHFFKPSQIKNRIQMIYKNRTSKWMLGTYVVAATLIGTSALFVAGCESQVSKENEVIKTAVKMEDDQPGNAPVFTEVEVQPEYPGGETEMFKFLGRNIKYPTAAARANVQGKVFVNFLITSTGEVKDVTVLKGIGHGCDEEAARIVSKFPKWTPGKQNGKAVNVKFTVPINFQLAEEGKETADTRKATVVQFKPVQFTFSAEPAKISAPTFTASGNPLYVLDGEVMDNGDFLKTISADDIESVSVLKDKSATNAYGDRGANGVISVITKTK